MARLPDIQLFSCPACTKLYKRRVDIWIDMSGPWQPSSPAADVPRICACGNVFLLSESTVVANLRPTDRIPNQKSVYSNWIEKLIARFRKPVKTSKKQLVKDLLWEMESIALPEQIAPETARVPNNRLS